MAKKIIWKDNTTPPTNYIWMKTDASGNTIGVYEYINGDWTQVISTGTNSGTEGTVLSTNGEVTYYTTMEQGNENSNLAGIVYRDENGVAQVATLSEDKSQWREEDVVNVSTMQTYVDDVMDGVAEEVVDSEQFNEMVTQIIRNSDITISSDPLWINV